jgi:hypothetical protein
LEAGDDLVLVTTKRASRAGSVWSWSEARELWPLKDLRMSQGSRARKTLRAALVRFIIGGLLLR